MKEMKNEGRAWRRWRAELKDKNGKGVGVEVEVEMEEENRALQESPRRSETEKQALCVGT